MISQQHHTFCAPQVALAPHSQDQMQHSATTKATTTIYPTIANIVSSSSSLSLASAHSSASPRPSSLPSPASDYESSPAHESCWSQSPEPELEPEPEHQVLSGSPLWWRGQSHHHDRQESITETHHSDHLDRRFNRPPSYPGAFTTTTTATATTTINNSGSRGTHLMPDGAYRIEELNDVEDAAPIGLGLRERAWSYSYPLSSLCRSHSPSPRSYEPYPRLPPIAPKGTGINGGSSAPSSLPSASTLYSSPSDLPPSLQYRRSSASSTTTTSSSCSSTSSFVGPVKSYLKASQERRRKITLPPYFDKMSDAQKRLYECHPPSPIHSDDGDDSESSSSDLEGSCSSAPSSAPGSPIPPRRRLHGFTSSFSAQDDHDCERELDCPPHHPHHHPHHHHHHHPPPPSVSAPPPPPPPPPSHYSTLVSRPLAPNVSPYNTGASYQQEGQYPGAGERAGPGGYHGYHLYRSSSAGSSYSSSGSTPSPAGARSPSTFFGPPLLPATTPPSNAFPLAPPMKPRRRVRASPTSGGLMPLSSPDLLHSGPGTVTAPDGTKVIKNKDGSIMVYNPQTDSVTFRCELCPGESFGRIHDLKRHQTSKHQEMTWPCDFCHRPFVRRDALLRHYTVKAARDDGLHPAAHEVEKLMAARARAKMLC